MLSKDEKAALDAFVRQLETGKLDPATIDAGTKLARTLNSVITRRIIDNAARDAALSVLAWELSKTVQGSIYNNDFWIILDDVRDGNAFFLRGRELVIVDIKAYRFILNSPIVIPPAIAEFLKG